MGAPEPIAVLSMPWWKRFLPGPTVRPGAAWVPPIGIEFGDTAAHFVQVAAEPAGFALRVCATVDYGCDRAALFAEPRRMRDLVRRALAAGRFRGRRVVSCLAADRVRVMVVNYKADSEAQIAAAVVAVVRERLKGDLEHSVLDFVPVRHADDAKGSGSAIVAVAMRADVIAHCAALQAAGLLPVAVDLPAAALCRLVRAAPVPGADSALVLQLQRESSCLTVMHGGRLIVQREIEIGEARIIDRLRNALDVDVPAAVALLQGLDPSADLARDGLLGAADAAGVVADVLRPVLSELVTEIDRTLVYLASKTRGGTVATIQLNGPAARFPCVLSFVREHIGIPVALLDPLRIVPASAALARLVGAAEHPEWALAGGLALRGAVRLG